MKKFLSLLLALAMVFTLAACGGNNAPATDGNGDNNSNASNACNSLAFIVLLT